MSGFQRGDKKIVIDNKTYGLRLTMGALAELNTRLSTGGTQGLSLRLRGLTPADGRVLLACVMRPCLSQQLDHTEPAAHSSDADIAAAMPMICRLFEEAFEHGK